MVSLTDNAKRQIRNIFETENKTGWGLRLGVKGGGCSGFSYIMDFAENPGENDQHFEIDDLKIIVDSKSLVYLAGTELDFADRLNGSGFVFKNPNATRSCGCGNSFAV